MPFCPHCGKEVSEGIKFCPECGERLKKEFTPEEKEKYIQELEVSVDEEKSAEKPKRPKSQLVGIIVGSIAAIIIIIAAVAICSPPELPSLTASERNYVAAMEDHISQLDEAMSNLNVLMTNPLIGYDEWTIDVATEVTVIRLLYVEAQEIEPPSSMAHIHDNYMQAMWHFNRATDFLVEGIDTLNADLLNQAASELLTGAEYMDEAAEQTEDFFTAHSS